MSGPDQHQPRHPRLASVAALATCLLLVALINASVQSTSPGMRWYEGSVGQRLATWQFDVVVDRTELATAVRFDQTTLTTSDIFVIVHWQLSGKTMDAGPDTVELVSRDGHHAAQRTDFIGEGGLDRHIAGMTSHGASVFEVPVERLDGAVFEVTTLRGAFYTYRGGVRIHNLVDPHAVVLADVELPRVWQEPTR